MGGTAPAVEGWIVVTACRARGWESLLRRILQRCFPPSRASTPTRPRLRARVVVPLPLAPVMWSLKRRMRSFSRELPQSHYRGSGSFENRAGNIRTGIICIALNHTSHFPDSMDLPNAIGRLVAVSAAPGGSWPVLTRSILSLGWQGKDCRLHQCGDFSVRRSCLNSTWC